ncbi:hypothetical protein BJ742DRAFT_234601 [Cladochytrium replicatum]|nr:hypothetical protein BJ742DRAFT_234601 [Cladochytrium replicatum]
MSLFRSQRERIVEQDRVNLKPREVVTRPPTPPQRSPLRNSPINARSSPVSLNPPNPENEDRNSTIWIMYDEYNNRSDSEPSVHAVDAKADGNDEEQQQDSEDSRRTSMTTISLSNFKRFLEQPEDSPYDTEELNIKLEKYLEKMANRRSWNISSAVPEARYSKVDASEADRIRELPTVNEVPRSPKKYDPVSHDDEKDVKSDRSQPSSATALPTSTPARRLVIPSTPQPEAQPAARPVPPTSEGPQKLKTGLEASVPLRGESIVASLNDIFAPPPASQQQPKTNSVHPPRSFIPDGARLPIQPSAPPSGTAQNKGLPTSSPPPQHNFLQHSPPQFTSPLLAGSPPVFYNIQQGSPPTMMPIQNNMYQVPPPLASHVKMNSPPLPPVPAPQASYSPPTKQNYIGTLARAEPNGVPLLVSPGSPPRMGPPPTQPRLAQLQVGQRLSPEEYRQVVSSHVLSSPETLVASSSDNDSATPYSGSNRKNQAPPIGVTDPKWPERDPTVIKMQRRHAGIVGPSSYTPPDYLSKIREEDITDQAPLSRKPAVTAPRPASGGSDKDVKVDDSRGRSRVRDEDGTARVRSSHRDSSPRLARGGLTINSGLTDYASVKSKGQVKLGDARQKRQELVRKRKRDVFVLKSAVLISVLNLLLVDAFLIFWLVRGGAGTLFGKA